MDLKFITRDTKKKKKVKHPIKAKGDKKKYDRFKIEKAKKEEEKKPPLPKPTSIHYTKSGEEKIKRFGGHIYIKDATIYDERSLRIMQEKLRREEKDSKVIKLYEDTWELYRGPIKADERVVYKRKQEMRNELPKNYPKIIEMYKVEGTWFYGEKPIKAEMLQYYEKVK